MAIVVVALLAWGPAEATGGSRCDNAYVLPESTSPTVVREATICLVNLRRSAHDRPPLRRHGSLSRVARRHARDMVLRGYFSHSTPEGKDLDDRIARSRYARKRPARGGQARRRRVLAAENLAWGERSRSTPAAVVASWMRSAPHRRLLLGRRFEDVGIGVVRRSPRGSGATYVAIFASR